MEHVIYALIDPISGEIRYIGYTSNKKRRYWDHHSEKQLQKNTHKNNWLKSLIALGHKADMIVLEILDISDDLSEDSKKSIWSKAESDAILRYKMLGCNLTNSTDGGDSPPSWENKKLTVEHKRKISLANTGRKRSAQVRDAMSNRLKGRAPLAATEAARVANLGKHKKHSDDTKKKISESCKGKIVSAETRRKISESHRNSKMPEEIKKKISESLKLRKQKGNL